MKNKLYLDLFREIRKNAGRFLSIFFIVLLGSAFFAGLRSSGTDMRLSADAYYDDTKMMDIKLLGTLGFTDAELRKIASLPDVLLVRGAKTRDVLWEAKDAEYVVKITEMTEGINEPYLIAGRKPEKPDECLLDKKIFDLKKAKIGDKITLVSGDSKALGEDFHSSSFTITGVCSLPYFLEIGRGNGAIGDGSVDAFLVVPSSAFKSEIYTEAYVHVKDTKSLMTYSPSYQKALSPVIASLEALEGDIGKSRLSSIKEEAEAKIKDAEKEVADGEKKLADGKKKLTDGRKKLTEGKEELTQKEEELSDAKKKLSDGKSAIANSKAELSAGRKKLSDGKKTLSEKKVLLEKGKKEYDKGLKDYTEGLAAYEKGLSSYEAGLSEYEKGKKEYDDGLSLYEANQAAFDKSLLAYEEAKKAGFSDPEKEAELEAGRQTLLATEKKLSETSQLLSENKEKLQESKEELDSFEQELTEAKEQLALSEKKLKAGEKELSSGKKKLAAEEERLQAASYTIAEKERELTANTAILKNSEEKLAKEKEKLLKKEKKLEKSEKEYEDKLPDAQAEIADARKKIREARKELLDLSSPDFYVLDRSKFESYVSFEQNSDRMDNIGHVFPVIFFLVASLVSLTAMTRMVDEGRMSMGILKAMGYTNHSISRKYLLYCMLATISGSLIGIGLGERFLPLLIIKSYGILFIGLPYVLTPVNYKEGSLALLAAVLSTGLATLASSLKQLLLNPASLMRPLPPKHGKRVLLERAGFLWRRLSFSGKATIRNLARYKKRLIMTVIGIGGCMGLLLVGFGLRDSISEIAKKQYVNIFTYDAALSLNSKATTSDREELLSEIAELKEIKASKGIYLQNVDLANGEKIKSATLFVPESSDGMDRFLKFRDRRKRTEYSFPSRGAFLSEKTAKMLDVKAGDTVDITKEGQKTVSVKVEKIVENYVFHYLFLSSDTFKELYGSAPVSNTLYLTYEKGSDERRLGSRLLSYPGSSGIRFVTALERDIDKMLQVLNLVITVLISSAGLLAFVVLYNLNSINIMERKRELATLKVLGFYDSEVSSYIYRENMLLTLFGILAGLLFGTVLHLFVIETVEVDLMMFGRKISPISYLLCILITFGFSALVNLVMHFSLKKIRMIESLKSVE